MTNKQRTTILRDLRKMITSPEDFGPKCPDYEKKCFTCMAHKALETLEGFYEDILLEDYEE